MRYEVCESRDYPGEWRVEAVNEAGDGEIYGAAFYGPDAERRAREFAARKNGEPSMPNPTTTTDKEQPMNETKAPLTSLFRENPATPEGKYLVKRRDGTVVEWPSFVLGGRDPHAEVALRAYADSIEKDPDCHPGLAAGLRRLADQFRAYREEHGTSDPTRGRHRKDDPATVAEMRKGQSA